MAPLSRRHLLATPLLLSPLSPRAQDAHAGLVPEQLLKLESEVRAAHPHIRALLIQRAGRTGFGYYRADTQPTQRLNVASVTKSITSLLAGIAIGQGAIRSVDESLSALFPGHARPALDAISLRHVLTMCSGLDHGASVDDYFDFSSRFYAQGWLAHALARKVVAPPGQRFVYSNTDAHLVAVALAHRVKRPLIEFARETLFAPLGIEAFDWPAGTDGIPNGAADMRLAAPDLLRIGRMVLQGGAWEGRQVVPRAYLQEATSRRVASSTPPRGRADLWGYGYLWWTSSTPGEELPSYAAAGYGGQYIYIVPALDLVIATLTEPRSREVAMRVAELLRTFASRVVSR
jgi:CubicO group peptidase (beta-lactamase class C family)